MTYAIRYSEEAAQARDHLTGNRLTAFKNALTILAEKPEHESSIPMGENIRHISLTQSILIEYIVIHQMVLILVLNVFDSHLASEE